MKKALIIALLWHTASLAAHAEVYLGARYGAGLSLIYFSPYQKERAVLTPVNAAVAFRYCNEKAQDYERHMNFLWELGYGERGYNIGDSAAVRVRSSVLEMPVMMQARIPVTKRVRALVTGLVYGTYYLHTSETPAGKFTRNTFPEPLAYNFHRFEYGVGGGVGASLSFDRTDFTLDARYMASMSYLFKPTINLYESMPMQLVVSFSVMRKIGR